MQVIQQLVNLFGSIVSEAFCINYFVDMNLPETAQLWATGENTSFFMFFPIEDLKDLKSLIGRWSFAKSVTSSDYPMCSTCSFSDQGSYNVWRWT